ncbi:hypothetical protein A5653_25840 [Mycobacterium colombiense]|uniref:hypothetical protein n=1 Tax=Mycobacterium colombiense TaxID=339268 RepID=UPI0007EFE76A|nr:hypothetical protein [Mycobacterium colombiense]OBK63096.1 hypothetical protein A5653_25840 [Mycobacterium colombiense]
MSVGVEGQARQRVAAIVRLTVAADVSDERLAVKCREKLARYTCPQEWPRADEAPRAPVGKPDHRAIETLIRMF